MKQLINFIVKKVSLKIANSSNAKKVEYIRRRGGVVGNNTTILSGVECFGTEPYLVKVV